MLCMIALIVALSLGNLSTAFAEESKKPDFKVVGYYSGDLFNEPIEKLQLDKLTHVMYAFIIPREDGSLEPLKKPEQLKELVEKGHKVGTKIYAALGGWSYQGDPLYPTFEKAAASKESRTKFVDNVVKFAIDNQLDGVEIDWEYPNANSIGNYESLVVELSKKLEANGKHLTAALNGAWSATEGPEVSKMMTDQCLNSFEFISVMVYDMNNDDHSPLWFANTSIDYWLNRGISSEKIVVGMPLYARPSWMQYRHLVQQNHENAYVDYVEIDGVKSYYNGINTLREKTMIALRKAGGVMLFDVNEDTLDDTSIVSMVDQVVNRTKHLEKSQMSQYITLIINRHEVVFDSTNDMGVPFIDGNGKTLVPFRKPLEAIGASITYDDKKQTATSKKNGITVQVTVGENKINVNGKDVPIETQAILKEDRMYLPIRAVFESFGYTVKWHDVSRTIYIEEQGK